MTDHEVMKMALAALSKWHKWVHAYSTYDINMAAQLVNLSQGGGDAIQSLEAALEQPKPEQTHMETGDIAYTPIDQNLLIGQLTVTNGRLRKRILKLQKQRDHFTEQNVLVNNMILLYPRIKSTYESYKKSEAAQDRLKELEARVGEQDLLIRILSKQKYTKHEVEKAYADIIKKAYTEMIVEFTW